MLFYSIIRDSLENLLLLAEHGGLLFEETSEIMHRFETVGYWQNCMKKVIKGHQVYLRLVKSEYTKALSPGLSFAQFNRNHQSAEGQAWPASHQRPGEVSLQNSFTISDRITVRPKKPSFIDHDELFVRDSKVSPLKHTHTASQASSSMQKTEHFTEDFKIDCSKHSSSVTWRPQNSLRASVIKIPVKVPFSHKHWHPAYDSLDPVPPVQTENLQQSQRPKIEGMEDEADEPNVSNLIANSNLLLNHYERPKNLLQDFARYRTGNMASTSKTQQASSQQPGLFLVPEIFSSCISAKDYTDLQLHLDTALRQKVDLTARKELVYDPFVRRLTRTVLPTLSSFEAAANQLALAIIEHLSLESLEAYSERLFEMRSISQQVSKLHLSLQQVYKSLLSSFVDVREFHWIRSAVLANPLCFATDKSYVLMDHREHIEKCLNVESYNFSTLLARLLVSSISSIRSASAPAALSAEQALEKTKQVEALHPGPVGRARPRAHSPRLLFLRRLRRPRSAEVVPHTREKQRTLALHASPVFRPGLQPRLVVGPASLTRDAVPRQILILIQLRSQPTHQQLRGNQ